MRLPSDGELKSLVGRGLFFVCATCPKWHEGKALGKDSCTGVDCGSPIRRKDFPEYSGDIKDFSAICFVCGKEDVLAFAKVEGMERQFGLCKDHLELVDDLIERKEGIVDGQEKKVFILPNPARVMDQYRDVRATL